MCVVQSTNAMERHALCRFKDVYCYPFELQWVKPHKTENKIGLLLTHVLR